MNAIEGLEIQSSISFSTPMQHKIMYSTSVEYLD